MPGAVQAAPTATIQSLIDAAPDGGTFSIAAGTYTESLTVNKTLTLRGVSSATTIIRSVTGQRVITVTSGHNLRLENLTVTGGHPSGSVGGGIFAANDLQIVNCRLANNSADYGGGVFQNDNNGRVDVIGSRIELNTTGNHGGGLYVSGNVALTNTQVVSNAAAGHGGGVHVQTGRVDFVGGMLANNTAGMNGGAVNTNHSLGITGTQFISRWVINDQSHREPLVSFANPASWVVLRSRSSFSVEVEQGYYTARSLEVGSRASGRLPRAPQPGCLLRGSAPRISYAGGQGVDLRPGAARQRDSSSAALRLSSTRMTCHLARLVDDYARLTYSETTCSGGRKMIDLWIGYRRQIVQTNCAAAAPPDCCSLQSP
ncbi:hypothetical protein TFLX_02294 [Thermoflexales bacterium]|nr:hypothetical protein TFLX_02294 [Thermoflexales bacterium]